MSTDIDALVEQVLNQCIFALGSGARIQIKGDALTELRDKVAKPGVKLAISRAKDPKDPKDTSPGADRWQSDSLRILNACVEIGQLAAHKALANNSTAIRKKHLRDAYNQVRKKYKGPPGAYCPLWPPDEG